ncbi:peptide-methionine (S)-S-oxide reductase MsrA [Proteiniclasticum ruminis]|uniref:Peptide methionine sulfoxide reductase MsrA n=1 Tax=Proteiniclasticum ruminis TaxID=398199 RepID=A0A1I4YM74_9CLOT|nr:peptide-methionine (S)-S-oxide reductase MsrA [Proteiniclasticum ruminis]SFN39104.1 peptide-methionine (S)-S-oxide reductase [Proteiniclasticum ruminis]
MREIALAGGCFWGVDEFFSRKEGILTTKSGYSNGHKLNPTYEEVCTGTTGHAETVYITYDENVINLETILLKFFKVIDPTSMNRQGNDLGTQYRTGIYFIHPEDETKALEFIAKMQPKYTKPIVVEVEALSNFFDAEEYHQDYLKKNPRGYCHIDLSIE